MNRETMKNPEKKWRTIEKTTKSGSVVRPPLRYRQNEYGDVSINYDDVLSSDEETKKLQ